MLLDLPKLGTSRERKFKGGSVSSPPVGGERGRGTHLDLKGRELLPGFGRNVKRSRVVVLVTCQHQSRSSRGVSASTQRRGCMHAARERDERTRSVPVNVPQIDQKVEAILVVLLLLLFLRSPDLGLGQERVAAASSAGAGSAGCALGGLERRSGRFGSGCLLLERDGGRGRGCSRVGQFVLVVRFRCS